MQRLPPLALALSIEWVAGDPPNTLHPVAWLGTLIQRLEQHAPRNNAPLELMYGAGLTVTCTLLAIAAARCVERLANLSVSQHQHLAHLVGLLGTATLLKMTFSWRGLLQAGQAVHQALVAGQLDQARWELRSLVSRDTTSLGPPLLAAAAIESLAENASDSFVAPLFYYQLFGLPGACAYRAVNTLDSMLGYHGRYEFLGKVPARLDDLLNWIPARLTALFIVGAAALTRANPRQAWFVAWHDHQLTASPNAGYPMSAIAGALNICLEKVDHYRLNAKGRDPKPDDIQHAIQIVSLSLGLTIAAIAVAHLLQRAR